MRRWVLSLALATSAATPAVADLAVMASGAVMKVDAYSVAEDRVRFVLPSGGELVVPLGRVERIVDDEIEPEPPAPPTLPPLFRIAFAEGDPVPAVPYGDLIHAAARRHGLNPELVAALIRAESAYDARAVSKKGARGLMQLMPATADRFGVATRELFEPERNIEAGTRYLGVLAKRFDGALDLMLAAYNAGEGAVGRYGGVPPYRETRGYLARIRRFLGIDAEPVVVASAS